MLLYSTVWWIAVSVHLIVEIILLKRIFIEQLDQKVFLSLQINRHLYKHIQTDEKKAETFHICLNTIVQNNPPFPLLKDYQIRVQNLQGCNGTLQDFLDRLASERLLQNVFWQYMFKRPAKCYVQAY